jgi:hypothetical protein
MNIQSNIPEWNENEPVKPPQSIEQFLLSDLNGVAVNGGELIDYSIAPLTDEPNYYPVVNLQKVAWSDLSSINADLKSGKVTGIDSNSSNLEITKVQVTNMDLPPPVSRSWDWWLEKVGVPLLCAVITGSAVLIGNLYN